MPHAKRTLADVIAARSWSVSTPVTLEWLGRLLSEEGVEIMSATPNELARGTPVFASADADLAEVQRVMARNHIRRLPVVRDGSLLGIVDIVELALQAEHQASLYDGEAV